MQTSELSFILQNSFTPDSLRALMEESPQGDPYDAAVEAILSDDESGRRIVQALDEASRSQREKIRSMSAVELRKSLSFEFLEKGRTLGLVVWALLRDQRISAHALAGELANRFLRLEETDSQPISQNHPFPHDVDAASMDEESEIDAPALEVDELLADLKGIDDHESDKSLDEPEEELGFPIPDDSLEEINELEWLEEDEEEKDSKESAEGEQSGLDVISEEEITREVNELIGSLGENGDDIEEESISFEDFEPSEESDETDWMTSEKSNMDIGEDLPSLEDVDSILSPYENLLAEADPKLELSKPQPQNGERIMLGGVMIRLQSLREACESIFEESVELVTDAELIGDDKVVVVGKECGIHVMYCSREKILPPPPEEMTIDESVTVSPQSLRQALSTIHGEAIEIIPDAELLAQGIVAFTGKKIGLAVVKHPRIRVPVDSWRDSGAAFNLKSSDSNELDALRKRVDRIESRLAEMSAVVLSRVEPEAEEDANISIETISIEDLEQDELEPISDPSLDESEDDDDFMAALSGIKEGEFTIEDEDGVEDDQGDDELALSGDPDEQDLLDDLEGLDLGEELSDDEDVPGGEDQEDKLELGDFGEELNLDDLSLDEVEDELGEGKKPEISSDDDEVDEEEFDLDVLNELDLDEGEDFTPHKVFDGEKILLLGGEDEHIEDYDRIIYELGGRGEWHGSLAHMQSEEIHELVNQSDLIVMVTADSLSDSGIIQAANYARDHNKRLFEHHSSNPTSIQKQLIKIVEEGNI